MKVNISISGLLRKPSGEGYMTLNISEGKTVEDILLKTGYKKEEITHILCFVNDRPANVKTPLKENDNLFLTLIVGGG